MVKSRQVLFLPSGMVFAKPGSFQEPSMVCTPAITGSVRVLCKSFTEAV